MYLSKGKGSSSVSGSGLNGAVDSDPDLRRPKCPQKISRKNVVIPWFEEMEDVCGDRENSPGACKSKKKNIGRKILGRKLILFSTLLWIRIGFSADLDPTFYLNTDPGPGSQIYADPDPGQTF
jgi:hypothetical protein